jgi:UDP:flavonoid glycosyltransferase YjiC (YdhE family)
MAREERDLREGFARRLARERAAALVPLYRSWQPDLIVWEETDFGAVVAAEYLGLPHANLLVIAAGSFVRPDVVGQPLNELRAAYGLPADPDLAMFSRHLVLSPMPPRYRDPAFPLPPTAHGVRLIEADPANSPPPWPITRPDAPTVYFTLGTIFNVESGNLFERVLAGLRHLPLNLLVTVGWGIDPAELGPQPPNVHVTQHIPQAAVLPHCDLVISHAGSGSVMGALAYGRPMLLIPMGADQPLNAARCKALGVAQVLDPIAATPQDVRAAATTVLETPSYRQSAQQLQTEIAALPGPEHTVTLLEQLLT